MKSAPLKILMFGWEFPPYNSGGLGVACQGLAGGLAHLGAQITFVLPKKIDCRLENCNFVFASDQETGKIKTVAIDSPLSPYLNQTDYSSIIGGLEGRRIYCHDLIAEVLRYASQAEKIAQDLAGGFDVIHCHDWLSLPAGLAAKKISGKPLIFQIHATEYDRVGENGLNREICLIEKQGLENADAVIAVSDYTKRLIVERYQINPQKIKVVPNAVNHQQFSKEIGANDIFNLKNSGKKIALFVGRLTFQKGPDYFLAAAKKVSQIEPQAIFVFSGSGDMERWLIEETARLGLADKVVFAGFLRGNDLGRLYKMADLYVMPSVSEPFGITALEAFASGTPVLISRQSGAGEMMAHCLKVDFWDVDQMAAKILAALRYEELGHELRQNGLAEVKKFNWLDSAKACLNVYRQSFIS